MVKFLFLGCEDEHTRVHKIKLNSSVYNFEISFLQEEFNSGHASALVKVHTRTQEHSDWETIFGFFVYFCEVSGEEIVLQFFEREIKIGRSIFYF